MTKLTKIVTLLVVSVALMIQVIAQDLSHTENEEEAYGASDRGQSCEDKWATEKCLKLAKKGKCENNRIRKWKCCKTCQQCSSNKESLSTLENKSYNTSGSFPQVEQIDGDCPFIGDGTDARNFPKFYLDQYSCINLLGLVCGTPTLCGRADVNYSPNWFCVYYLGNPLSSLGIQQEPQIWCNCQYFAGDTGGTSGTGGNGGNGGTGGTY